MRTCSIRKAEFRVNDRHSEGQEFSAGRRQEKRTRAPSLGTGSVAFCLFVCSQGAHLFETEGISCSLNDQVDSSKLVDISF